jgi:DNA-binding transcriptional MerR regulator
MVSNKQLEANRRNAELSTGPVTDEGKSIVSKNRVSHGVLSRDVVLPGMEQFENVEDFKQLKESLEEYWNPEGVMEESLCEDLAIQWWRMRRLYRHESGSLKERHENTKKFWYDTRTESRGFSDIPKEVLGIDAHKDDLRWHKEWLDIVDASLKKRRKSLKLIFDDEDCLCMFSDWFEDYDRVEKAIDKRRNIPNCLDDDYEKFVVQTLQKAGVSIKEILEYFKIHLEYQIKDIEGKLTDKLHQYEMEKEQILPSTVTNESFLKYEASIRRNIEKDIKLLLQLQAFRTGAMFSNNRNTDD